MNACFIIRFLTLFTFASLISGCAGFNGVTSLAKGGTPSAGRAVVVYGIRVESPWRASQFEVSLDAYNVEEQALGGSCWRHDRTIATVPGVPGSTRYFSFEVLPAHYVYGGWGAPRLRGGTLEFDAPKDRVVFIGEFAYTQANDVELRRDLEAVKPEILAALPIRRKIFPLPNRNLSTRFACSYAHHSKGSPNTRKAIDIIGII